MYPAKPIMGVKDRAKRAQGRGRRRTKPPALLGQNPDLVFATVVDVFHKVGELGCALWPAVLLHELVPSSEIEEGFGVIDARMCYRAIWVAYKGERYDPATAIPASSTRRSPNPGSLPTPSARASTTLTPTPKRPNPSRSTADPASGGGARRFNAYPQIPKEVKN